MCEHQKECCISFVALQNVQSQKKKTKTKTKNKNKKQTNKQTNKNKQGVRAHIGTSKFAVACMNPPVHQVVIFTDNSWWQVVNQTGYIIHVNLYLTMAERHLVISPYSVSDPEIAV